MTDIVEVLRQRDEYTSQRAADEIERGRAAVAELVVALKSVNRLLEAMPSWAVKTSITRTRYNETLAAITKHDGAPPNNPASALI